MKLELSYRFRNTRWRRYGCVLHRIHWRLWRIRIQSLDRCGSVHRWRGRDRERGLDIEIRVVQC